MQTRKRKGGGGEKRLGIFPRKEETGEHSRTHKLGKAIPGTFNERTAKHKHAHSRKSGSQTGGKEGCLSATQEPRTSTHPLHTCITFSRHFIGDPSPPRSPPARPPVSEKKAFGRGSETSLKHLCYLFQGESCIAVARPLQIFQLRLRGASVPAGPLPSPAAASPRPIWLSAAAFSTAAGTAAAAAATAAAAAVLRLRGINS